MGRTALKTIQAAAGNVGGEPTPFIAEVTGVTGIAFGTNWYDVDPDDPTTLGIAFREYDGSNYYAHMMSVDLTDGSLNWVQRYGPRGYVNTVTVGNGTISCAFTYGSWPTDASLTGHNINTGSYINQLRLGSWPQLLGGCRINGSGSRDWIVVQGRKYTQNYSFFMVADDFSTTVQDHYRQGNWPSYITPGGTDGEKLIHATNDGWGGITEGIVHDVVNDVRIAGTTAFVANPRPYLSGAGAVDYHSNAYVHQRYATASSGSSDYYAMIASVDSSNAYNFMEYVKNGGYTVGNDVTINQDTGIDEIAWAVGSNGNAPGSYTAMRGQINFCTKSGGSKRAWEFISASSGQSVIPYGVRWLTGSLYCVIIGKFTASSSSPTATTIAYYICVIDSTNLPTGTYNGIVFSERSSGWVYSTQTTYPSGNFYPSTPYPVVLSTFRDSSYDPTLTNQELTSRTSGGGTTSNIQFW